MSLDDRVIGVLSKTFGVPAESITPDAGPTDVAGWDSVGHVMLIGELEQAFGVSFTIEEVTELSSVRRVASCLRAKGVPD